MDLRHGDSRLVQIVDAAVAVAAGRSGGWLVCKPGCTQCCIGPFAIDQLDALRLREGLSQLDPVDPQRAARVRRRAQDFLARFAEEFPGDPITGILDDSEDGERQFEAFADDEPCPALDPTTGMCDLYAARPITCRVFGPPLRSAEGLGVCELCYHGATDEQIADCEVQLDEAEDLRSQLLQSAPAGQTIVAFALR